MSNSFITSVTLRLAIFIPPCHILIYSVDIIAYFTHFFYIFIEKSVEFETAGTWEIYFTERGVRDFGYAKVGYSSLTPKVVEVGNGGTAPTGELDVKLSGAGKDAFYFKQR